MDTYWSKQFRVLKKREVNVVNTCGNFDVNLSQKFYQNTVPTFNSCTESVRYVSEGDFISNRNILTKT